MKYQISTKSWSASGVIRMRDISLSCGGYLLAISLKTLAAAFVDCGDAWAKEHGELAPAGFSKDSRSRSQAHLRSQATGSGCRSQPPGFGARWVSGGGANSLIE
jgi:hypothetical protein